MSNSDGIKTFTQFADEVDGKLDRTSEAFARFLDEHDTLRELRNNFHYPKAKDLPRVDLSAIDPNAESIYLCGHSLGLQPKGVEAYIQEQLRQWAQTGVHGHKHGQLPWATCDEYAIEGCARMVGAKPSEIGVMNALTVNIHLLLTSFYRPTSKRFKILLESKAFPSDHYAIESQIRLHGYDPTTVMICLEPRKGEHCLRTEDILETISKNGDEIAVVFFSGVQYYTGQLFDIPTITAAAQKQGCLVGWDLAHAAGNVPLYLHDWNVDFAAWCSYKYINSGAGGMGIIFLHERHAHNDFPKLTGWWGHDLATRFDMTNQMQLSPGPAGYRISNPAIFLICPLMASLDVFAKVSMEDLRRKSIILTGYLEYLIDHRLGKESSAKDIWEIITPRDPRQRGCQLSLKFAAGVTDIFNRLEQRGVACDLRVPDVIRVAPVHLYNSFLDVFRFVQTLVEITQEIGRK